MMRWMLLVLVAAACGESKEEKQKECDSIANTIKLAAQARGITNTSGLCGENTPAEFVDACNRLRECNRELDEL